MLAIDLSSSDCSRDLADSSSSCLSSGPIISILMELGCFSPIISSVLEEMFAATILELVLPRFMSLMPSAKAE